MTIFHSHLAGGLGDVMLGYFHPNFATGYAKSLKEKHPNHKFRLVICSSNPHAKEIVEANPHVDEVISFPFSDDFVDVVTENTKDSIDIGHGIHDLTWEKPEIFLNPEEQIAYDKLISLPKLVCLHPFAGDDMRCWKFQKGEWHINKIINFLCDNGFNVALLGGSSIRTLNAVEIPLEEEYSFYRPGVVNLINAASIKLQCKLSAKSQFYIGSNSCYSCIAASHKVPSLVVMPEHLREWVRPDVGIFGMFYENQTQCYYWDQYPENMIDKVKELITKS